MRGPRERFSLVGAQPKTGASNVILLYFPSIIPIMPQGPTLPDYRNIYTTYRTCKVNSCVRVLGKCRQSTRLCENGVWLVWRMVLIVYYFVHDKEVVLNSVLLMMEIY